MKVEINQQRADELVSAIRTAKRATSLTLATALKKAICAAEMN